MLASDSTVRRGALRRLFPFLGWFPPRADDLRGDLVAGLSVAGPSDRFTADRVERYTLLVRRAAADISQRLGFPPLLEALTPVNGRAIVP